MTQLCFHLLYLLVDSTHLQVQSTVTLNLQIHNYRKEVDVAVPFCPVPTLL